MKDVHHNIVLCRWSRVECAECPCCTHTHWFGFGGLYWRQSVHMSRLELPVQLRRNPSPLAFFWLVLAKRVLHHPPEACLHQVWSSSLLPLHSPPHLFPLPLISFPLTLTNCDLGTDNRTAPPFLTARQLTHFQRGVTLFPYISLMSLLPFPLCSWKGSLPTCFYFSFPSILITNTWHSHTSKLPF